MWQRLLRESVHGWFPKQVPKTVPKNGAQLARAVSSTIAPEKVGPEIGTQKSHRKWRPDQCIFATGRIDNRCFPGSKHMETTSEPTSCQHNSWTASTATRPILRLCFLSTTWQNPDILTSPARALDRSDSSLMGSRTAKAPRRRWNSCRKALQKRLLVRVEETAIRAFLLSCLDVPLNNVGG